MPFALTFIGLLLIVVGFQDTYKQFGTQVVSDFSGPKSFFWWIVALGVVGAIGYVKELQGFSRAFMALIIVVIFLSNNKNGNLFQNFNNAITAGSTASVDPIGGALPASSSGSGSGGGSSTSSGGGGILGDLGSAAGIAALFL